MPIKQIPSHIPAVSQCLEFFDRYEMLDNIRAHSIMVARVAGALVDGLYRTGRAAEPLPDPAEVTAAALLHDIAKTLCIQTSCHHAEVGRRICIELGYPEIGEIVAEHVVLNNFTVELYRRGLFGAKEIVFYADKRVRHDQVVVLADRLVYIIERYGDGNPLKEEFIKMNFQRTVDLETILFSFLDFTPDEVQSHI